MPKSISAKVEFDYAFWDIFVLASKGDYIRPVLSLLIDPDSKLISEASLRGDGNK